MNEATGDTTSDLVLVVTPTQKDAAVTRKLLGQAGIRVDTEADFAAVARRIDEGVGALLITDLALANAQVDVVLQALRQQPSWSGLPVLALCQQGTQSPVVEQLLRTMVNVTILDRPTSTRTLVSALQAALRGRQAQYQIRDQIARLREAEETLRQVDRRKDEFLATLAHELRNPLAPLRNGISLLERLPPGDARVGDLRGMMDRQLRQLVKLIDELLDVSRIATGKIALERKRVDMREIVQLALESCEPAVAAAGHRVTTELPGQPVCVDGDAARLAQVVSNLVGNSVKYTPAGGEISVRLAEAAGEVRLAVTDNGAGIPAPMLDQVFELFAQVNQTLDRAQGGLGIGLSLARRLVQLHGGSIQARSEGSGRGSTFELHLPAAPAPADEPAAAPTAADTQSQRALQLLVIDDNVDAADSLGMLLRALGHDTDVVYSATDALRALDRVRPDAVFCDIGMPGMDGYAFAAAFRSQPRLRDVRLVALTGWGAESDKSRTFDAGFDLHLTKPADPKQVQAVLHGL
ncbi:ATP-binding protein [Ramlibacter humi]|uniref:histidine kinase n=1 Tax=Ramlibacter humi TaxID=2530451 RepID=A0A4Z0BI10_9BURK|nr:ATP-binding protein [Ramlibacter humi]TFY98361.1 hybrid sensor histidine kinase/response regulator [Ramlibacter humi]